MTFVGRVKMFLAKFGLALDKFPMEFEDSVIAKWGILIEDHEDHVIRLDVDKSNELWTLQVKVVPWAKNMWSYDFDEYKLSIQMGDDALEILKDGAFYYEGTIYDPNAHAEDTKILFMPREKYYKEFGIDDDE